MYTALSLLFPSTHLSPFSSLSDGFLSDIASNIASNILEHIQVCSA